MNLSGEVLTLGVGSGGTLIGVIARWVLQVNRRLASLETKGEVGDERSKRIEDKVDLLVDRLL